MRRTRAALQRPPLEVLGLNPANVYSSAEVRDAFYSRAKALHPDAGGDAEKFKELNSAYTSLRGSDFANHSAASAPYRTPQYSGDVGGAGATRQAPRDAHSRREHMYYERYNVGGERRTWDYGDGAAYANESTRHFYRPYSSAYADPSQTGFTEDEIRRARFANYMFLARRAICNVLLYGLFFYVVYGMWRNYQAVSKDRPRSAADRQRLLNDPSRPGSRDDDDDSGAVDWREFALRDSLLRQMAPRLREHWSDAQKEAYIRNWNADFSRREARARSDAVSERGWTADVAPYESTRPHRPPYTRIRNASAGEAETRSETRVGIADSNAEQPHRRLQPDSAAEMDADDED